LVNHHIIRANRRTVTRRLIVAVETSPKVRYVGVQFRWQEIWASNTAVQLTNRIGTR
jgi:hypothetical protein